MLEQHEPILVLGATGRQGGSVVKGLIERGRSTRALVRNAECSAALELGKAQVELIEGDFDDLSSLQKAFKGAVGVFIVLPGYLDPESEVEYGRRLVGMACDAGVKHLVYSSGAHVRDSLSGIPSLDAKPLIEAAVRLCSVPYTIVRPMTYMDRLIRPSFGLEEGQLISLVARDRIMQVLAIEDIGRFVTCIFEDGNKFSGCSITLASDAVSGSDLEEIFTEVAGRRITYSRLSDALLEVTPDLANMASSMIDGPLSKHADLSRLREMNPHLTSFRAWLSTAGHSMLRAAIV